MPARAGITKGRLALILLAALSVSARSAETTPPAAPTPATPAPAAAAPSPAAVADADKILNDIGLKQSIALVVPGMMVELETNVTRTRPEIRDSLRATLKAIQPEFDQTAKQTYSEAAALLASQMSEKEIARSRPFLKVPWARNMSKSPRFFFRSCPTSPGPGAKSCRPTSWCAPARK